MRITSVSAALGFALVLSCQPVPAQPRITEDGHLRIASWNLQDAATAGVVAREKPVTRSWRNTFGAERRVEAKPTFGADRLKADVVLLQGVKSVRQVRQIFPARDWKLILSRQVLRLGGGRLSGDPKVSGEATITAVAIRYQLRLRVTGIEHLSDLDGRGTAANEGDFTWPPESDGGAGSISEVQPADPAPGSSRKATGEAFADGLALRLSYSGSMIWVVSAALPSSCRQETATCLPAARLKQWADGKRSSGFGIVVGGQLDASLRKAGPGGVCADQEIVADRALKAETGADTVAGCVAFVDVEGNS